MPGDRERPPAADGHQSGQGVDLSQHAPFPDSGQAAAVVLQDLRSTVGFGFWAVTRVTGETYVIVTVGPGSFAALPGEQFAWGDTLCRQVLDGHAPRVAPDVQAVAAYRDLPLVQQWRVGAYLSAPLTLDGTSLYGTVCAVDPQPQSPAVLASVAVVDRQARLLATVLAAEAQADGDRRRVERAEARR